MSSQDRPGLGRGAVGGHVTPSQSRPTFGRGAAGHVMSSQGRPSVGRGAVGGHMPSQGRSSVGRGAVGGHVTSSQSRPIFGRGAVGGHVMPSSHIRPSFGRGAVGVGGHVMSSSHSRPSSGSGVFCGQVQSSSQSRSNVQGQSSPPVTAVVDLEAVKRKVASLPDKDYANAVVDLFDTSRPPETQRIVVKRIQRKGRTQAQLTPIPKGVAGEGIPPAWPGGSGIRKSRAAGQVPFIFRGDCIPEDDVVFFDTEMLNLKMSGPGAKHKAVASSVAVVGDDRELIMWAYIGWQDEDVCTYYPTLTGITKEKLESGLEIEVVSDLITRIFEKNLVVGFNMKGDLDALKVTAEKTEDLASYFKDEKNQSYSLRDLITHFFKKTVQCGMHSAIQDARMTRDLYYKRKELEEKYPDFRKYPEKVVRTPSNWTPSAADKCTCPKSWKVGKRKGKKKKKPTATVYSCYEFDDEEESD